MPDGIPVNNPETFAHLRNNLQRLLSIQPGCIQCQCPTLGTAGLPAGRPIASGKPPPDGARPTPAPCAASAPEAWQQSLRALSDGSKTQAITATAVTMDLPTPTTKETLITDLMHNAITQQKIINSIKSHDFLYR